MFSQWRNIYHLSIILLVNVGQRDTLNIVCLVSCVTHKVLHIYEFDRSVNCSLWKLAVDELSIGLNTDLYKTFEKSTITVDRSFSLRIDPLVFSLSRTETSNSYLT